MNKYDKKSDKYYKKMIIKMNSLSEEDQIKEISYNGCLVSFVNNPSINVQLAAVNKNVYTIAYIANPSEEAQISAVNFFDYNDANDVAYFVKYITSQKAMDLYYKLKKVNSIIK